MEPIMEAEHLHRDYITHRGVLHRRRETIHAVRDLSFTVRRGEIFGLLGQNGAGKTTFLRILSGDLEPTSGEVSILPKTRMSVLKQDQNAYDAYNVMDTVIMGNQRLYEIGKEKDALYAKEEMTEEDGIQACLLEEEFAELGGWEAESDASRILQGLGIGVELHYNDMSTLDARLKVKVLLAQALFGSPDILLLDEPTNNLDIYHATNMMKIVRRLCDELGKTVILVLHEINYAAFYSDYICAFKDGKIAKFGTVEEVMTKENLSQIYQVDFEILTIAGKPLSIYY